MACDNKRMVAVQHPSHLRWCLEVPFESYPVGALGAWVRHRELHGCIPVTDVPTLRGMVSSKVAASPPPVQVAVALMECGEGGEKGEIYTGKRSKHKGEKGKNFDITTPAAWEEIRQMKQRRRRCTQSSEKSLRFVEGDLAVSGVVF